MATEKPPAWKVIVDAQAKKSAELAERLRAARLARDAAAPPVEPKKRRASPRTAIRRP